MTIYPGRVVNGRVEVEVDDPAELPEGAEVSVFLREEEEYIPTPEEAAELEAAIEEADLGGGMPADEFLREMRAMRETYRRR
jgi:hypothetical protein